MQALKNDFNQLKLIIHTDINSIRIVTRCNRSIFTTAANAAIQRVIIHTVNCRQTRKRCVIGNLVIKTTITIETVGNALGAITGASQIACRSSGYTNKRRGRRGVGITGYLYTVAIGGALDPKCIPTWPAVRQLRGEFGKGGGMVAKIERTEGNTILAGGTINQAAIRQRQGYAKGATAACRNLNR